MEVPQDAGLDSGFRRNDGMLIFAFCFLPQLTEWILPAGDSP
jgi:hypothetical protein